MNAMVEYLDYQNYSRVTDYQIPVTQLYVANRMYPRLHAKGKGDIQAAKRDWEMRQWRQTDLSVMVDRLISIMRCVRSSGILTPNLLAQPL